MKTNAPQKNVEQNSAKAKQATYQTGQFLTTKEVATLLKVSTQWVEIGRVQGYGPPFIRVTKGTIRYRYSDVINWMNSRLCTSTADADLRGIV